MTDKNTYTEMLAIAEQKQALDACRTYRSFDAYVAENPDGELYRQWITNDGTLAADGLVIFSGDGTHGGIPGGFLWATLALNYVKGHGDKYVPTDKWYIHVHDGDDGLLYKEFPDKTSALQGMDELAGYAPASMHELVTICNYKFD